MVITVKVVKVLPEPLPQFTFKDDRIRTEYYTKKILIDNQDGVITHLELFFFFKPRANDYTTKQLILLKDMFKASACYVGDLGSIPGLGRSPGEGNGNPLQYSCLENPMDRGAWWATVHGVTKSQTRLSDFTFTVPIII